MKSSISHPKHDLEDARSCIPDQHAYAVVLKTTIILIALSF